MIRCHIRRLRDKTPLGAIVALPFSALRWVGVSIPEFIYRHLPYKGQLELTLPNGGEVRMRSRGEILENGLYWRGMAGYEPEWLSLWLALTRQARGVIDIGANTGLYSLIAAAANPRALVHAFEPVPRIADRLQENILLNSFENVVVYRCAVGENSGEVQLFDPGGDNPYSASIDPTFLPGRDPNYTHEQGSVYQVPVRSLDDILSSESMPPDLIKVDAEGAEIQVLRGATRTIERYRPTLLLEYLSAGTELDDIVGRLMAQGYRLYHACTTGLREVLTPQPAAGSWNVLLHPCEKMLPQSIRLETSK